MKIGAVLVMMPLMLCLSGITRAQGNSLMVHNHAPAIIPNDVRVPRLAVDIFRDESNGFNLHLQVQDYQLEAPELAGDTPAGVLEGHAHILINGKKRVRLYSAWIHLDQSLFKPGLNQLTVTLNSHQHESWVDGRQPLLATVFIDPEKEPPIQHSFSSSAIVDSP